MDARTRLRQLGQLDLGCWIEAATGKRLWSIQQKVATAASKRRARVAVPSCNAPLRHTEPVLTPSGWRAIGTLEPGDVVYSASGQPTTVLATHHLGRRQLYRFYLDSGVTVDSSAEHLWAVDAWERDRSLGGRVKVRKTMSTADLVRRYGDRPHSMKRVSLPMVSPVEFPERPVPLDPYLLGLLLGDGGITDGVTFTTADEELVEAFRARGYGVTKYPAPYAYGIRGAKADVIASGIHGHRGPDKFIPDLYLWNSPEVRRQVLRGLMDTDGGISGGGTEFGTSSEKLAQQVRFLVQSLGGRASIRSRTTASGRIGYRVQITLPPTECPFALPRKADAWHRLASSRRKTTAYTIQRIEAVDTDDVVCITVADDSHLFVIDNFVVTHNSGKSWLAARLALAFYDAFTPGTPCVICGGPCGGSKILTTSSSHEHLRDALWSEMRIAYYDLVEKGIFDEKDVGRMGLGDNLRLESGPDHFLIGRSPKKAEGFQGFHAPHKLILGDEATSLDDEMQQGITGLLATADSRLLLIFNPTTDDTYAALETRSPRTEVIRIRAWDTPHFTGEEVPEGANLTTPEWLEELKEKGMGPGTYEWTTRVEAEFWTLGDDVLITGDVYDRAFATAHVEGTRALGVDLAPYGSDENVIAYRDGNGLVKLEAFPAMDPRLFFEGPVTSAVERFSPDYLIFDADGVGAGVIGYAEDLAAKYNQRPNRGFLQILPFRGGIAVDTRFNNARSAWWWAMRRRFTSGNISLAPFAGDQKLREQITDIRYSVTQSGDIKVEPKDQMKRRGKESPDRADACLAPGTLVVTRAGTLRIEDVRAGDVVWTRDGWRPVLRAWQTSPRADRVRVRFDDGSEIVGTPEHPVWDGVSFSPLGDLTPGCTVPAWTFDGSTALHTPDIQTHPVSISADTGGRHEGTQTPGRSTVSSTSSTTGRTTDRSSSTTETGTPSTTTRRTSKLYHAASTIAATALVRLRSVWRSYVRRLRSGIGPMRVVPGTESTPGEPGKDARSRHANAECVGGSSRPTTLNVPAGAPRRVHRRAIAADSHSHGPIGIVPGAESMVGEPGKDARSRHANAKCVGGSSRPTTLNVPAGAPRRVLRRVVAVDSCSPGPVYNLTVAGRPEFLLANGVLVHNCMYAFSLVEELPVPAKVVETPILDMAGVKDRSVKAMRERDMAIMRGRTRGQFDRPTPWSKLPPGVVWDDIDAW